MSDGDKFVESYEILRECGLLLRREIAAALWASLLGANAQAPLADVSAEALPEVVEALPPTSSPQDEQTMPEKAVHN
jgi:hypothetical protein